MRIRLLRLLRLEARKREVGEVSRRLNPVCFGTMHIPGILRSRKPAFFLKTCEIVPLSFPIFYFQFPTVSNRPSAFYQHSCVYS